MRLGQLQKRQSATSLERLDLKIGLNMSLSMSKWFSMVEFLALSKENSCWSEEYLPLSEENSCLNGDKMKNLAFG